RGSSSARRPTLRGPARQWVWVGSWGTFRYGADRLYIVRTQLIFGLPKWDVQPIITPARRCGSPTTTNGADPRRTNEGNDDWNPNRPGTPYGAGGRPRKAGWRDHARHRAGEVRWPGQPRLYRYSEAPPERWRSRHRGQSLWYQPCRDTHAPRRMG